MKKKPKSGFTLIELLIVIAIIGILAAIVIVATRNSIDKAKDVQVRTDIGSLARVLASYQIDTSYYPKSNKDGFSKEGLVYNLPNFNNSDTATSLVVENYINKMPINERTQHPYVYWSDGAIFNLQGYLFSQPLTYYEAYTTPDDPNIRFREVLTDASATLGWPDQNRQVWISKLTDNGDTTFNATLNWRPVSGYNGPFTYKVLYKEYTSGDDTTGNWVTGFTSTNSTFQTTVQINGLASGEWSFQVVAYDSIGKNTENANEGEKISNPLLLRADLSSDTVFNAITGDVLFRACTNVDNNNLYCSYMPEDMANNEVRIITNGINCPTCNSGGRNENSTDLWGLRAAYRLQGTNDWAYVGEQLPQRFYSNGSQPLMMTFFVPKGTYEFKLWVVSRNGLTTSGNNANCYTPQDPWNTSVIPVLDLLSPSCIDPTVAVTTVNGSYSNDVMPPLFPQTFNVTSTKVDNGIYRVEWPLAIDNVAVDKYTATLTASYGEYQYNQILTTYGNNATFSGITAVNSGNGSQIPHTIKIQAFDFNSNRSEVITKIIKF